MADRYPDYDLDDVVVLDTPAQFKAIGDPLRFKLLGLLSEQAATTSQLATALDRPKGTVGHHLKVLEAAGLVRVVRTRRVRALTEKYYGRVARRSSVNDEIGGDTGELVLRQALAEMGELPDDAPSPSVAISHRRLSPARAEAYAARLSELHEEFDDDDMDPAGPVFGLVSGVYETAWPRLTDDGGPTTTPPTRKERSTGSDRPTRKGPR